jgi:hypothetical protein
MASPLTRLLGLVHIAYGLQRAFGMDWETYRFEVVLALEPSYQLIYGTLETLLGVVLLAGVEAVNSLLLAACLSVAVVVASRGVGAGGTGASTPLHAEADRAATRALGWLGLHVAAAFQEYAWDTRKKGRGGQKDR